MKHPKIFGKRPILMQRALGGVRIIYPDGQVEFTLFTGQFRPNGCTSRRTQKEAYLACVEFDQEFGYYSDAIYSAFLGYL